MFGEKFGRLTVTDYRNFKNVHVLCDCGRTKVVNASNLRKGKSRSCGCLRAEQMAARNRTHGMKDTREHASWNNAIQRCHNPRNPRFDRWGGRGIKVCDRWRQSFEQFIADMGQCPPGCTLDRIKNDFHYSPMNCRWATPAQQANNTRRNIVVEHDGRKQTVTQWARELGIKPTIVHKRIYRGKLPAEALFGV